MPSTHTSLHFHVVFSTKNREEWLQPTLRSRVHEYIGGIVRGQGGVAHVVGGVGDHVHVLIGVRATHCLSDVMREVKADSSRWFRVASPSASFFSPSGTRVRCCREAMELCWRGSGV